MQLGLEVQSSPGGTRACALGSVPSARDKPIPCVPQRLCIQHGAIVLGKPEGFVLAPGYGGFRLSWKRCSNFIRNIFFPPLFRNSRSSQVRKSAREKRFALGNEACFS